MVKLSLKEYSDRIVVKRKLAWGEVISEREIQIIWKSIIPGLAKAETSGKKIVYDMPACVLLSTYLAKGITIEDFYKVILKCVNIVDEIEKAGLNINNLVFNQRLVGINPKTGEMKFVYQPVINRDVSTSVYAFINDISYSTVCTTKEDNGKLVRFKEFVRNMEGYSGKKIEEYISREEYYTADNFRRKEHAESGNTETFKLMENFDDYENDCENDYEDSYDDFRRPMPLAGDDRTILLFDDYDDRTVVLNESEIPKNPYLIKISTNEKIQINKQVFKIGKERKSVDYCVKNNGAVSRHHADIIEENHNYYIKDLHSTNCTYINRMEIAPGQLKKLNNGDVIMLANEIFEFYF